MVERDLPVLGLASSPGADVLTRCAARIEAVGLRLTECRVARADDLADLGSSWAKRLGIPDRRLAWLLRAEKPQVGSSA